MKVLDDRIPLFVVWSSCYCNTLQGVNCRH